MGESKKILLGVLSLGVAVAGPILTHVLTVRNVQNDTVAFLARHFESVDASLRYEEALTNIYNEYVRIKSELEALAELCAQENNQNPIGAYRSRVQALENELESLRNIAVSDDYLVQLGLYRHQIQLLEVELRELTELLSQAGASTQADSVAISGNRQPIGSLAFAFDNYPAQNLSLAQAIAHADSVLMGGNTYRDVIISRRTNIGGTNFSLHNLGQQFHILSGYVGRVDGSSMVDATIRFFGDGVYMQSFDVAATDMPVSFSVGVTGITQLRIETALPRGGHYAIQAFLE